jgi:hypothetical protein
MNSEVLGTRGPGAASYACETLKIAELVEGKIVLTFEHVEIVLGEV